MLVGDRSASTVRDPDGTLTRRRLLQIGGTSLAAVGGSGLLAACGSSSLSSKVSASGGGAPRHGGTLRFGGSGGANTDTLDAQNPITNQDFARLSQLYDPLVRLDGRGQPEFALAESLTPNRTATEWTIRIRKGVVTHDGRPLGAKDVLFTYKRIFRNKYPATHVLGSLDVGASRVVDPHTVVLKFDKPFSVLPDALTWYWFQYIVPEDYDPRQPIGTGPFKLQSFSPGLRSVMVRNAEYWDHPKPYLDEIVTLDIADETAQINALQSGQVDAIDYLTAGSIATLQSSSSAKLVISERTGGFEPFTMRVDNAPLSDTRVRTALKLVVDRPAMLKSLFAGHGQIGNDVFGIYDRYFDPGLLPQRHQDLEQAKSLLKSAGYSDLSLQLVTTTLASGTVQAAEVFATQAKGAGVRVDVVNQPATDFFAKSYLKSAFSQDYYPYSPYFVNCLEGTLAASPFNATHFANPRYNELFAQVTQTLKRSHQAELAHEMMKIDYEQGGELIPFFFPVIDAVAPHVYGVEPSVNGQPLSTFQFQNFWLSKE